MNKSEFDKIFNDSVKEVLLSGSRDDLAKTLAQHSKVDGKISSQELALFAYTESIKKSKELIYSVLLKVLDIAE